MNARLVALADAFIARTKDDRLLAISEGFIKVRCMETALDLGWTLQEGTSIRKAAGEMADCVSVVGGKLAWARVPRRVKLPEGSSDFAVVAPFQMMLEIKGRPDHGAKSQSQFQQMDADVERIAGNPRCAFFFVFDLKSYLSYCGEKLDNRGRRPSREAEWFIGCFPKVAPLQKQGIVELTAARGQVSLDLRFSVCARLPEPATVLIVGCRTDAPF